MKYSDIRSEIKTGDIVGIEGTSFASSITRFVQKLGRQGKQSNITHIAIAYWIGENLFVLEMDGKYNVIRPLSVHATATKVHIWECPVDRKTIEGLFNKYMSKTIHYSMLDNFKTGLRLIFGIKQKDTDSSTNCSIFAFDVLRDCGFNSQLSTPSPSELAIELGECKFLIDEF
jgi:hypothetical protein